MDSLLLAPSLGGKDDKDPQEDLVKIWFKARQPIQEHIKAQLSTPQMYANRFVTWHTVMSQGILYTLVVIKRKEVVEWEKWNSRVTCGWKFLKTIFAVGDEKTKKMKAGGPVTLSQIEEGVDDKTDGWKLVAQRALGMREWERITAILGGNEDVALVETGTKLGALVVKVPMTVQEAREARKRKAQAMEPQAGGSTNLGGDEADEVPLKART